MKGWIKKIKYIPFRTEYMYWDRKDFHYGEKFFDHAGIDICIKNYKDFVKDSLYTGVTFSCWNKDKEKVEKVLNDIDKILKIKYKKTYKKFLIAWEGR